MEKDKKLLGELSETLMVTYRTKNIDIPSFKTDAEALKEIKKHLEDRIVDLMDYEPERFLNTLYRIDVDENKVREILDNKKLGSIPSELADLIIERQLQRLHTRRMYKKGGL